MKPYVNRETLIQVYNTLIQPHFDYCDVVWANLANGLANRLQKLQNRAARVITKESYDTNTKHIRKQLGWETLAERRNNHKACLMYKIASYLSDKLATVEDKVKSYNLRNIGLLTYLPQPKTNHMIRSFMYQGIKQWNNLPIEFRHAPSLKIFKRKVAGHSRAGS